MHGYINGWKYFVIFFSFKDLFCLQEKLQRLQTDSHKRVAELEDKYAKVDAHRNELSKYIRELEQTNDDLERVKRLVVT